MKNKYLKLNPYDILNVPYDAELPIIREQFKKLILKTHPDRGGDAASFQLVKQAYMYLYNYKKKQIEQLKKEQRTFSKYTVNRDLQSESITHEMNKTQHNNLNIDPKKKFNKKKFNQLFTKFKIDDADDRGYTILKSTTDREEIKLEYNKDKIKKQQVAIIDVPEPIVIGSKNYKEFGKEYIDNFSKKHSGGDQNFTDYQEAYTQYDLEKMGNVRTKEYKNVKNVVKQRSNINYKMNEYEKINYDLRIAEEKEMEEKRRFIHNQQDQEYEKKFKEMQNYITM